ncbi:MAG: glycine cleavage system aminomethyltransferase GcvT, partial [Alphaproteobacteria bacterium]|nr:glycine cleavage system aminomethyltransferase GcvT [Alphaproteobacteria bacterium]
ALETTPLESIHRRFGARMAPFAGYSLPIQYPTGIVNEHHHTRSAAGLFDVSHMGVLEIEGEQATNALERLIPCDLFEMCPGQMRYGVFMLDTGGILDDLLITRRQNGYLLVVNASRKVEDLAYLQEHLGEQTPIRVWENPVMVALQGPKAALVLGRFFAEVLSMPFMTAKGFGNIWISRSGYTGEDGFEILMPAEDGISLTEKLLEAPEVKPIGLGARDSLRLEAGLCLYGHELNEDITPVEAGISWSIGKRRRQEGGFLGADNILSQLAHGPSRRRVGLVLEPGGIAREGAEIQALEGKAIGQVSSGGHSPTLGHPIAMGYVESGFASVGGDVLIQIRGQARAAKVVKMPFVPHSYYKN